MKLFSRPKSKAGSCSICCTRTKSADNELLKCAGSCNLTVHKNCYGAANVPKGAWFCERCAKCERAGRIRCELCPLKDGVFKRTETNTWCHVVCALFVPKATFANKATLEPIKVHEVPADCRGQICSICKRDGRAEQAGNGGVLQCGARGCRERFHATCAQNEGLLVRVGVNSSVARKVAHALSSNVHAADEHSNAGKCLNGAVCDCKGSLACSSFLFTAFCATHAHQGRSTSPAAPAAVPSGASSITPTQRRNSNLAKRSLSNDDGQKSASEASKDRALRRSTRGSSNAAAQPSTSASESSDSQSSDSETEQRQVASRHSSNIEAAINVLLNDRRRNGLVQSRTEPDPADSAWSLRSLVDDEADDEDGRSTRLDLLETLLGLSRSSLPHGDFQLDIFRELERLNRLALSAYVRNTCEQVRRDGRTEELEEVLRELATLNAQHGDLERELSSLVHTARQLDDQTERLSVLVAAKRRKADSTTSQSQADSADCDQPAAKRVCDTH